MKKLGINTASAIMNIIGASFYLLAITAAAVSAFMTLNKTFIILADTLIRLFSIAGCIVAWIAYGKSKKVHMTLNGQIMGFIGHLTYALFGVCLAVVSLILCILGAVFTMKYNLYVL